jgi:hypothetical protein
MYFEIMTSYIPVRNSFQQYYGEYGTCELCMIIRVSGSKWCMP